MGWFSQFVLKFLCLDADSGVCEEEQQKVHTFGDEQTGAIIDGVVLPVCFEVFMFGRR